LSFSSREAAADASSLAFGGFRRPSAHNARCAEWVWQLVAQRLRHVEKQSPFETALLIAAAAVVEPSKRAGAVAQRAVHKWTQPVLQSCALGAVLVAQSGPV
jgi:hypothetical protein